MVLNDHDILVFHGDISFSLFIVIIIAFSKGQIWAILRYGD
jgi:hypothetical protein